MLEKRAAAFIGLTAFLISMGFFLGRLGQSAPAAPAESPQLDAVEHLADTLAKIEGLLASDAWTIEVTRRIPSFSDSQATPGHPPGSDAPDSSTVRMTTTIPPATATGDLWTIRLISTRPSNESRFRPDTVGSSLGSTQTSIESRTDSGPGWTVAEIMGDVHTCVDCGRPTDNAPDVAGEVFCTSCRDRYLQEGRELQAAMDAGTATTCHFCGAYAPAGRGMCDLCIAEASRVIRELSGE